MANAAEGARGDGGAAEDAAPPPTRRKIRPEAVWAEVRKAWEAGETVRSAAGRYDVGVPALWKRRGAEGWKRPAPAEGLEALLGVNEMLSPFVILRQPRLRVADRGDPAAPTGDLLL